MDIINAINSKTQALVRLGLTDENEVRRALTTAIKSSPNRNPHIILQQQYTLMANNFMHEGRISK